MTGREYKVPTFTLPRYGQQLLMLAMEPTKLLGYRDSYLFFHKHPTLKRVRINDEEKAMLKGMGMLVQWFKHRDVAVVTARSVFKCFGSKIVKRGRRIRDDYYETEHPEERLTKHSTHERNFRKQSSVDAFASTPTHADDEEEEYDNSRKSLIAKTARSEGYSSNAPLTNQTWMHHAALAARGFNAQLHERRAAKPTFYDIHTNINQVPASYQSKSCKFEFVKDTNSTATPLIDFVPCINTSKATPSAPLYCGIGKDLLDYNVDTVLEALPLEQEKEELKKILTNNPPVKISDENDDDTYPLTLMEGQFQAKFPM